MSEVYYQKEEAEKKLLTEVDIITLQDCPVFKTNCKGDSCISFYRGEVICTNSNGMFRYFIKSPGCCSPLTNGIMTVESYF